jgi:hypothetical protein
MDEDRLNMSTRKFLKHAGVTSQQEIERVVRGKHLSGNKLMVRAMLTAEGTDLNYAVECEIELPPLGVGGVWLRVTACDLCSMREIKNARALACNIDFASGHCGGGSGRRPPVVSPASARA